MPQKFLGILSFTFTESFNNLSVWNINIKISYQPLFLYKKDCTIINTKLHLHVTTKIYVRVSSHKTQELGVVCVCVLNNCLAILYIYYKKIISNINVSS